MAMAAGSATIQFIKKEALHEHAALMGQRLLKRLLDLQTSFPQLGDIRGRGLMIGVEIIHPNEQDSNTGYPLAAPSIASAIQSECLRHGLIIELGGRHGSVVRFLPPLITTERQIDHVFEIFSVAVQSALKKQRLEKISSSNQTSTVAA